MTQTRHTGGTGRRHRAPASHCVSFANARKRMRSQFHTNSNYLCDDDKRSCCHATTEGYYQGNNDALPSAHDPVIDGSYRHLTRARPGCSRNSASAS